MSDTLGVSQFEFKSRHATVKAPKRDSATVKKVATKRSSDAVLADKLLRSRRFRDDLRAVLQQLETEG